MVFLFGALCYTICTMKAPPQALEGAFMVFTEASSPGQGLERRLRIHGVPFQCSVLCSVLCNMHHEGSSPGPSRAWGGAFMAFITPCACAKG